MSAAASSLSGPSSWGQGWSTGRKLAATAFVLLVALALVCTTLYLAGVMFLLLNKANPRQAGWTSVLDYWTLYAADPHWRRQLIASLLVPGVALLGVLPVALFLVSRPRRPLHGDARFASTAEIRHAGLLGAGHADESTGPAILVGRYQGKFLSLPGQLSVMLSAPTRSGKGVGVVIPNLLNWPHSAVVLDIKGENFDITAGYRATHGQAVWAFSPFDEEARSHRWNPLSTVRTSALHRVGDLLAIGQVFYPNDSSGTSSENFFNDHARNLFLGLGLLLLETPSLPRSLGEMLRQSSGKGQTLKEHLQQLIRQRQQSEGSSPPSALPPLSDECVDALQRLLSNSDNTLSSIVGTFTAPLTMFADAVVDAATSADDFQLSELRRRPMTVYVRIPPNRLANAKPLLNLFFSQLVSLNTHHLPSHDAGLRYQCLLVNDEFTAMGRVGIIASAAAFLAGYNLRLLTVIQAMSQLDAVYGDKEARSFATNHGLQILFAPREQRDADEYSAMLGQFTQRATSHGRSRSYGGHGSSSVSRNDSEQRRALLLPQEFKELGSERQVLIAENCKPILAQKIRYHREPVFKSRLLPPPLVPRLDMDLHLAKVQQRWRYADDELAEGEAIDLNTLDLDISAMCDFGSATTPESMNQYLDAFFDKTKVKPAGHPVEEPAGGTIQPDSAADAEFESAQAEGKTDPVVVDLPDTPDAGPPPAPELDLQALE
jgi:type IV secretion system protein VirD4